MQCRYLNTKLFTSYTLCQQLPLPYAWKPGEGLLMVYQLNSLVF